LLKDENCAVLDYHAASSGDTSQTTGGNLSVPFSRVKNPKRKKLSFFLPFLGFFAIQDGTDGLSRNVGKELPLLDA